MRITSGYINFVIKLSYEDLDKRHKIVVSRPVYINSVTITHNPCNYFLSIDMRNEQNRLFFSEVSEFGDGHEILVKNHVDSKGSEFYIEVECLSALDWHYNSDIHLMIYCYSDVGFANVDTFDSNPQIFTSNPRAIDIGVE